MMILDTTLRDGSYVNNFQFSSKTTFEWCARLDENGIDYIEVGHGIGLMASERGYGRALQSDLEYMTAADRAVKKSKWGVFAIPGICHVDDLNIFDKVTPSFVRLGVGFDNISILPKFINFLKSRNIECCVNFMKSHTQTPVSFSNAARKVYDMGADFVYIVDSAGNMTPRMLENYMERLIGLPIGFHGHNNLGLANANALIAYQCGARVVDSSMTGLGRSAGNTVTEQIVPLLNSLGGLQHVNTMDILNFADEISLKLAGGGYLPSLDVVCGYAGFHSSYMEIITKISKKYDVDPRHLIIEVCKHDQISLNEKLAEECAKSIKSSGLITNWKDLDKSYFGSEQKDI